MMRSLSIALFKTHNALTPLIPCKRIMDMRRANDRNNELYSSLKLEQQKPSKLSTLVCGIWHYPLPRKGPCLILMSDGTYTTNSLSESDTSLMRLSIMMPTSLIGIPPNTMLDQQQRCFFSSCRSSLCPSSTGFLGSETRDGKDDEKHSTSSVEDCNKYSDKTPSEDPERANVSNEVGDTVQDFKVDVDVVNTQHQSRIKKIIIPATNHIPHISRANTSKRIPPKEYPLHAAQHLELKSGPLGNDEKWKDALNNTNDSNVNKSRMSTSRTRAIDHSTRFDVIGPIEMLIFPRNASESSAIKNGKEKVTKIREYRAGGFITVGSQKEEEKVLAPFDWVIHDKKQEPNKNLFSRISAQKSAPEPNQTAAGNTDSHLLSRFGEKVKGFLSLLRDTSGDRKEDNDSHFGILSSDASDLSDAPLRELEALVEVALSRVSYPSHHRRSTDTGIFSAIKLLSTIRDFTGEFYEFCGYEVHCRVVANLAFCKAREGQYKEAVNLLEIAVLPVLMAEDQEERERIKHIRGMANEDKINTIKDKTLFLQCALAWCKAGDGDYNGAAEIFATAHQQLESILQGPSHLASYSHLPLQVDTNSIGKGISHDSAGPLTSVCDVEPMKFLSRCASFGVAKAVGDIVGISPRANRITLPQQFTFGINAMQPLRLDKFYLSYARFLYNVREYREAGVILQELLLKQQGLVMDLAASPLNQTDGELMKGVSLKRDEQTDGIQSPFSSVITELECYMMYGKCMRHIGGMDEAIAAFDHCIELQKQRRQMLDNEVAQLWGESKDLASCITSDHLTPYCRFYGGDWDLTVHSGDIHASPLMTELCFPEYEKAKCLQYCNGSLSGSNSPSLLTITEKAKQVPSDSCDINYEEGDCIDGNSEEIETNTGDGRGPKTTDEASSDHHGSSFPLMRRAEAVEAFEAASEVFMAAIGEIRRVLPKKGFRSRSHQTTSTKEQKEDLSEMDEEDEYSRVGTQVDILCEQLCVILEMYGHMLYDSALCYESHPDYGPDASIGVLEECLRILEEAGLTPLTARIRLNYGHCLLLVRRLDEAIEQYAESMRILLQQDTSTSVASSASPQISEDGNRAYLDLGEVHAHIAHCYHYYIGVYDMAERHYFQALEEYGMININGLTAKEILSDTTMRADIVAWALEGRAALRMRLHDYESAVNLLGARTRLGAHYKDHCVTSFLRLAKSLEMVAVSVDPRDGGLEDSQRECDVLPVMGVIKSDIEQKGFSDNKKHFLEGAKGAFNLLLSIHADEIDPIQKYELCKMYANLADAHLEDYALAADLYAAALSLVNTNPHTYVYYATCLTKVPGYNAEKVGKVYEKAVAVLEMHRIKIEESKKHIMKEGDIGNVRKTSGVNQEIDDSGYSKELTEFLAAIQPHPYGDWDAPFIFGECAVFNHAQQELSVAHEYYKMALQCCGKLEYLLEASEEHHKYNMQSANEEEDPNSEEEDSAVRAIMEAYPLPSIINAARIRVNYAIFLYDTLNTSDGVEELFHEALSLTHSDNFEFLHAYVSYLVNFRGEYAKATKLLEAMVIEFPTKTKEMAHLVATSMSAVKPEEITNITNTFIQAMGGECMLSGKEQNEAQQQHAAAEADRIGLVRSEIEDIIRNKKNSDSSLPQKKGKISRLLPSPASLSSNEEPNYLQSQVLDCLNSVRETDVAVDYLLFLSQKTLNFRFADTCFKLMTDRFPDNVVLRLHYASFLAEKIGARERAKKHILAALYHQPNNAVILCNLAQFIAHHYPERGIEADKVFRYATKLHPNDETVALSYALFLSGTVSPAREKGDEDDDVSAYVENTLMGEDCCDDEASSEAIDNIHSDSDRYESHSGMFTSFSFSPQMALSKFQRALEIKPKDPLCHAYFGTFLEQCGKIKMVTQDLKRADALFISAYKHLFNAVSLDPNNASAHLMMGAYLCNQSRNREAWTYFQKSLELEPQNTQNLLTCSLFLIDWHGALSEYQDYSIDSGEGNENQHRQELKQVANAASICLSSAVRADPYNIVLLETYARFMEEVLDDSAGAADVRRAIAFVVRQTIDEAKRSRRGKRGSDNDSG